MYPPSQPHNDTRVQLVLYKSSSSGGAAICVSMLLKEKAMLDYIKKKAVSRKAPTTRKANAIIDRWDNK